MSSSGPTLVILAAGMGSRFGGLKQIEPVGPGGETIIEFSLHDAIAAGFEKVVFVVRRSFEVDFRERFSGKMPSRIETALVFQEMDSCLEGFPAPADRQKPWGTGHAVLVAKEAVREPFAVINADDFYGPGAFRAIADYLRRIPAAPDTPASFATQDQAADDMAARQTAIERLHAAEPDEYALVGYTLRNTLSEHGTVNRGLCQADESGYLTKITELLSVGRRDAGAVYLDENGEERPLGGDETVSMNLWGFAPSVFDDLQRQFHQFLRNNPEPKREFQLPTEIDRLIEQCRGRVRILPTDERWFGITYPEDRELAEKRVAELISEGVYPQPLWNAE